MRLQLNIRLWIYTLYNVSQSQDTFTLFHTALLLIVTHHYLYSNISLVHTGLAVFSCMDINDVKVKYVISVAKGTQIIDCILLN